MDAIKFPGRSLLAGMALLPACALPLPVAALAAPSTCVTCHKTVTGGSVTGHSFAEWEHSRHAAAGIACQFCHGGDAGKATVNEAHLGLRHSSNPDSPLYFRNIPEMCGTCHAVELRAFKGSRHFTELKRTGKGPNCITCHGAMAASVPSPATLQNTCASCHAQPLKVYEALTALSQARRVVNRARTLLGEARSAKLSTKADEREATEVDRSFKGIQARWHGFKMDEVLADARGVSRRAGELAGSLDLRLRHAEKAGK